MTPEQAIDEAKRGALRPVYLVTGEERFLVDRVVAELRAAASSGPMAAFNEEKFVAPEASPGSIVSAARSLPMMASRRTIVVRGLERWEKRAATEGDEADAADDDPRAGATTAPLDALAEYAKDPSPTTLLVLVAGKLHAQRRLVTLAKKQGFLVACEPLPRHAVPGFIRSLARERGHIIEPDACEQLAEIGGAELAPLADAIDRLSLYVGPGNPITEDAVVALVTRVPQSTVWQLLDALAARKLGEVLRTLADVYDAREGGLRLLGLVSWSVRQLVKFEAAVAEGKSPAEAAARAGVPPFKAQDMARTLRGLDSRTLGTWLARLAEADLALKGSRRPPQAVLETLFADMCRR